MTVVHMSAIDVGFLWGMLSQAVDAMLSSLDLQQEEARGGGSMRSVAPAVPGPITFAHDGSQPGPSSAPSEMSSPMVRLDSCSRLVHNLFQNLDVTKGAPTSRRNRTPALYALGGSWPYGIDRGSTDRGWPGDG
jgi:hypothetical protein